MNLVSITNWQSKHNQEGVVLIIALMVLSLIMVSALSLAKIIFNEVRMSINTGNSVIAYYSAESGIEQSLFSIKYSRQQSDFDSNFLALDGQTESIDGTEQSYTISQAIIDATGYTAYDVSYSSPAYVDIIDPSGRINTLPWDGPIIDYYNYGITWVIKDCFPYHAADKLEISYTGFDSVNFVPEVNKRVVLCNCQYYSSDECQVNLSAYTITNDKYYRFMLRPLDSIAASLDFNVYLAGNPVGIISQAAISVEGNYHNSTYTISARLPSLVPVSHALNYVIFSEEPVIKDL